MGHQMQSFPPPLHPHQLRSRPFLSCLNYSSVALHRVQDSGLFCPQHLGYYLTYLRVQQILAEWNFTASYIVSYQFPSQSHCLHGFLPNMSSSTCLKPFPYKAEFQLLTNIAFQGLHPTYPPVSPVTMPLISRAHYRAHCPLQSFASVPLCVLPCAWNEWPPFALANTHNVHPSQIDVLFFPQWNK